MKDVDVAGAVWFKSSRSNGQANCVETAMTPEVTAVRDSKDRHSPVLCFAGETWRSFVEGTKSGASQRS